ncbi:hypothetical protein HWD99_14975, partial [Microbacterium sp. C5A9]|nr:hypothetical protein [Microbacterium sp. C5A9]
YGDTTTATLTTPGHTWHTLGLPQFTPTPTSHTYTQPGDYPTTLTTTYTVDINLGTEWTTLPQQLTTTSTPHTIHILEAHTALITHTCTENPHGTGC